MRGLYQIFSQAALLFLVLAAYTSTAAISTNSLVTSDGYTYVYDQVTAHNASMPTFLFIHGYPASRYSWHHQIRHLADAGYGVIAPDSLGYGDSSKPTAIEAYNLRTMADHMTEILDAEGVDKVIGVGHDWGSGVLSRTVVFHPERFSKLVFVSVGFTPPGILLDVDGINEQGLQQLGYTPYGYWYFFNSYDSAGIISQDLESFFHLLYPANTSAWGTNLGQLTAARAWLAANKITELPSWLSEHDKDLWLRTYSQPDTVAATLNYYQALMRGVQVAGELLVTDEDRKLRVPVLGVSDAGDLVTLPDAQRQTTEPWAEAGYQERSVQAGHWVMLEKPDEMNQILVDFAQPVGASA
ncbi:alpha/beta-hydrolase [Nemania sp. FL0916]|nr:alpha/beta-hydrolase [Nemania sp. FL0916]